jgi:hypothetical protein
VLGLLLCDPVYGGFCALVASNVWEISEHIMAARKKAGIVAAKTRQGSR